jgi:hypothetical protein
MRIILSSNNKKEIYVDDEDYDWLNQWKWCVNSYAYRKVQKNNIIKNIFMHRLILKCPDNKMCDHKDLNKLNNQKSNLRFATVSQNNANRAPYKIHTSIYKGVSWDKENKKWVVQSNKNNRTFKIGRFDNEIDAAKAYDKKAKELFGEFAWLNFKD